MNIINFFDDCRFWGNNRKHFLQKIRFYGAFNRLIDITANCVLPIYFLSTGKSRACSLHSTDRHHGRIIVSLTSYPARIPHLWKVIECLLRQTVKPDKIVLYLTRGQVGSVAQLPKILLAQQKRGLEIRFCDENIRSHTKYYYAFQQFPDDVVITVDDDLFYRTDLVETLIANHKNNPDVIIANWVKVIHHDRPFYKEWEDCKTSQLSNHFLLLGVHGVLYPPHCMPDDVFNISMIKELCLTADDVWLSCMASLARVQIYYTGYKYHHLPILSRNTETLLTVNRTQNQVCVDNMNEYYLRETGVKPF